ncbi:MAG: tRNA (cytidine(34)-2'-O)-methyltransferase [Acholeplasmatales bacterium]|jgi:tRNA (cytidine/uridine-2'-O-)-methyltransferase|nr:tRNA (cytidine(34)-2'-O)-methyltransferase [Acholeplasmatales bacterium]MDD7394647.1 tRNA (cytidine(34)-2'-O)-methyltransferase [Acholeplasmatales bacterium]MDY4015996.1 tRNA (cytidine(34)-2'-O)-methyltransferase [Bacilli bacterium]CDD21587.1 putative tRNA (cytidine(34)-2'-O)-methyltransferase [Firmicutes bacterium CAG:313]HCX08723.1 tRNA (cytidine(34)-2'-O)-methyltransferase [Acholeplasmatales bacterium]
MAKNNIVLYEPEIPQNTGNIMRTCAGTDTMLHLIKPLGFKLDEASIKRSAVNYLANVNYIVYENWQDFLSKNQGKMYFFTRYGLHTPHELKLNDPNETYYFIIGKESTGIPKEILREHLDDCIRLPINDKIRSLNVSNVAAVAIFEALRQQDYNDLSRYEPETLKGKDWLLK